MRSLALAIRLLVCHKSSNDVPAYTVQAPVASSCACFLEIAELRSFRSFFLQYGFCIEDKQTGSLSNHFNSALLRGFLHELKCSRNTFPLYVASPRRGFTVPLSTHRLRSASTFSCLLDVVTPLPTTRTCTRSFNVRSLISTHYCNRHHFRCPYVVVAAYPHSNGKSRFMSS